MAHPSNELQLMKYIKKILSVAINNNNQLTSSVKQKLIDEINDISKLKLIAIVQLIDIYNNEGYTDLVLFIHNKRDVIKMLLGIDLYRYFKYFPKMDVLQQFMNSVPEFVNNIYNPSASYTFILNSLQ